MVDTSSLGFTSGLCFVAVFLYIMALTTQTPTLLHERTYSQVSNLESFVTFYGSLSAEPVARMHVTLAFPLAVESERGRR